MEKSLIEVCFDYILKDLDSFASYNLGQYLPVDLKEKMFSYYTSSISNEPSNSPFPITSYPEDRYRDVQLVNRITCQRVIPLCFAMWSSLDYRYEKVRKLIEEEACDVNESDLEGFCPLHYAAIYGRIDACKLLLIHGADCSRKNNFGKTPSDLAQDVKVQQMIKLRALLFSNVEVKVMEQDLQLKRKQIQEYQKKKLREEFLRQSKLINNVLEKKGYDKKIQSPLSKERVVSPSSPIQQQQQQQPPLPQLIFNTTQSQPQSQPLVLSSPIATSNSSIINTPQSIPLSLPTTTITSTNPLININSSLINSPPPPQQQTQSSSSFDTTPPILNTFINSSANNNNDIIENNSNINHLSTSLNDSNSTNSYRAVIAQIDLPVLNNNNSSTTISSRVVEGSIGTRTRHTMISPSTPSYGGFVDSTTPPTNISNSSTQLQSITTSIDSISSPSSIASSSPASIALNNNNNSNSITTNINSLPTTFQFVVDSGILNHLNHNIGNNNHIGGNINININININNSSSLSTNENNLINSSGVVSNNNSNNGNTVVILSDSSQNNINHHENK